MKDSKGLFEKQIDLKNAQISGGRLQDRTFKSCSTFTGSEGCRDSQVTMSDDNGKVTFEYTNTW